jgi:hypothetical protein
VADPPPPDPIPADLSAAARRVFEACEADFEAHKGDCSGFVRAVGARLGIALVGLADEIVDALRGADWTPLADGSAATAMADAGRLVVAGLKGRDQAQPDPHGHVVVVVAGALDPAHGLYPHGYWGRLHGVGHKNTTLNWAWRAGDLPKVIYACRAIAG